MTPSYPRPIRGPGDAPSLGGMVTDRDKKVFGGGSRLTWRDLPAAVRALIEGRLGSPVVGAVSAPGGFTPGLASRVDSAAGSTVFIKAISAAQTPDGPLFYRREIEMASALPAAAPAPRLLWSHDDGDWVVLAFEHVEGRNPDPAVRTHREALLQALERLALTLTPSPVRAPRLVDQRRRDFSGWRDLLDTAEPASVASYGQDVPGALSRLAVLEEGWAAAADGETLLHGDVRTDNTIITPDGRLVFVDWPHACLGAAWVDLVLALPSLAMAGVDAQGVVASHPLTRDVDPRALDCVVVAVAGFFVSGSLLPAPPGLPTLREFQRRQAVACLEWLRRRSVLRPNLD